MFGLDGKVALVTGAGQGIGRAIALALSEQSAAIAATDLDVAKAAAPADLVLQGGGQATSLLHQVAMPASWISAIATIDQRFERLDALVNNAGFIKPAPFA